MKNFIDNFKVEVQKAASHTSFIHHCWFVKYHLEIVEKISLELCAKYPKADKDLVLLLVWLHDYGKIIDYNHQYQATLTLGKKKLIERGFPIKVVKKVITYMEIFDKKEDLMDAPIEVKIVSSADAASHLVGPFYEIFWKEFHDWTYEALLEENKRKALVDWEKKIVLPEVKKAFIQRHKLLLEHCDKLPEKYL